MEEEKFIQTFKSNEIDNPTKMNGVDHPTKLNGIDHPDKIVGKEKRYHSLAITSRFKIKTYVPILPLKFATFMWFAAARSGIAYYVVFLKSIGLSVTEMSVSFAALAGIQTFLAPAIGAISDKLAIPKLVLILSILLTGLAGLGIVFIPTLSFSQCRSSMSYQHCEAKGVWNGSSRTCFFETSVGANGCEVSFPSDFSCWNTNTNTTTCPPVNSSSTRVCQFQQALKECVYGGQQCLQKRELDKIEVKCDAENRDVHLIWLLVLMFVYNLFYGSSFRFFSATATYLVKEHDSGYGPVRVWSIVGSILGPIISSYAVYYASTQSSVDYKVAFYVYAGLCLVTAILSCQMEVHSNPGKKMWSKTILLLKDPEILIFALSLVVMGTTFGFFNAFTQWFLADIGTPPYMFGFLYSFSDVVGVPVMFYSKWIFSKVSNNSLIFLALIARFFVCVGYYYLTNPWITFPLEIFGIFHYHLIMVVMMHFVLENVPEDLTATVHSSMNTLYFYIGRLIGGAMGGLLMQRLGGRMAFMVIGIINLAYALIFIAILRIRKICKK